MGDKNEERKNQMLGLAKSGYTYTQIGKTFGLTKQRVHQIIGIKDRTTAMTVSEKIAKKYLEKKYKYEVYKNSSYLPDFTCIDKEGKIIFVEVKSGDSWKMTNMQKIFFKKMTDAGYEIKMIKVRKLGNKNHILFCNLAYNEIMPMNEESSGTAGQ